MMDTLLQDLRYALRTMRRSPGFVAIAALTIAIGVGANAAIFSIVNAILLRPLPYPRADELIRVSEINRQTKQSLGDATPANFLDWRARNHSFTGLGAFESTSLVITGADRPERIEGAMVTANFFDLLDARPTIGRSFAAEDGAARVAVLSDGLWRRRFGARTDIVGETVRLNDEPTTIVGVAPPGVDYPDKTEIWITPHFAVPDDPLLGATEDPSAQRTHGYFLAFGRLKPGVSMAAAQADMDALTAALERAYPNVLQNVGVSLVPLRAEIVADVKPVVTLLFAAVGLLLLIATANVSGLLIARATARHQEIAVRIALGATRRRVLRQLLTESLLLAALGAAGGVLLAMWLIGPLVALSPDSLTVAGDIGIDGTVLAFTIAVSVAAGLVFGLAPARQLGRISVHDDLKQSGRGGAAAGQRRIRASLVAAEVALSLVLLVAAGLTVRSFIRLQNVSSGFAVDNLVTVRVSPTPARYATPARRADFYEQILGSLRAIPGVTLAGATSRLPLQGGNSSRGLNIPGIAPTVPTGADYRTATPDYFRAMGIPLLRGRTFTEADREGRPLVALISQSAAQRYWPNKDPIGEHFSINAPDIVIVGVVGDVHSASLEVAVRPTVYVPYRQDAFPFMTYVLQTAAAPGAIAGGIREAIWQIDRDQAIGDIKTMDQQLSGSLSRRRFGVTLLTAFGVIAVALAAVGLYGVLAFIVAQRRREIGVRMALGARPRDVATQVMGQGLRLAGLGIAAGIALAAATTRLMTSILFGTSPTDVATFVGVATLLVVIAGAASLVPALRASRVDPILALRDE